MLGGTLAGVLGYPVPVALSGGEGLAFDGRVAVVTGAGRGIGRAHAMLLAERGASVVVNDLGGSMDGRRRRRRRPRPSVAAQIVAARRPGGRRRQRRVDVDGARRGGHRARARATSGGIDILVNNAGIIRWAGPARCRRRQPGAASRRACRRLVQHDACGLAALGRAGLRPDRDDHLLGRFRPAGQPLVRRGQGRRHRPHPQPRGRRRAQGHQGQRAGAGGYDAHGRAGRSPATPGAAPTSMAPELVAPDGGLPRPRGLPGDRRDLRRGRGPFRADLPRLHARLCARRRPIRTGGHRRALGDHQRREPATRSPAA